MSGVMKRKQLALVLAARFGGTNRLLSWLVEQITDSVCVCVCEKVKRHYERTH